MTLITGHIADVGMNAANGVFIARAASFRADGETVIAPSPASFPIVDGAVSANVAPGPTVVTIHVGPARKDWFVNVPESDVGLGDLIADFMDYEPAVVSAAFKARDDAELAAGEAEASLAATLEAEARVSIEHEHIHLDIEHVDLVAANAVANMAEAIEHATAFVDGIPPYLLPQALDEKYATLADVANRPVSQSVTNLVVSEDDAPPTATPGTLLFLLKQPSQFFTDFTEYELDQPPSDWSAIWGDSEVPLVQATTGATGGVALVEDSPPNTDRAFLWDSIGEVTDVEVVFKWQTSIIAAPIRPGLRLSSPPRRGYHAGIRSKDDELIYLDGTSANTTLATQATTASPNVWYITRMRADGQTLRVRTWAASGTEPSTWLEATDGTVTSGGVGLVAYGKTGIRTVDWFGVGLRGQSAPMVAVPV